MKKTITRGDFLEGIVRLLMASLLALIAVLVRERIITGKNCTNCPGNGICSGNTGCKKYGMNEE